MPRALPTLIPIQLGHQMVGERCGGAYCGLVWCHDRRLRDGLLVRRSPGGYIIPLRIAGDRIDGLSLGLLGLHELDASLHGGVV